MQSLSPQEETVKRKKNKPSVILIYGDSEKCSDQLYFGRFFVPDPFISMGVNGKKIGVFNALEIERARKESAFEEILSWEEWKKRIEKRSPEGEIGAADIILEIMREKKINQVDVSADFPFGVAQKLIDGGLDVTAVGSSLFPEREIKNEDEIKAIRQGNACSASGIRVAEKILRASTIRAGKLWWNDRYLTSERLKEAIEMACLEAGGVASNTIAAGGDQACDPHCSGSGILRANQLIIVDVFPRMKRTGYHGDMTRTFLKGKPSEEQQKLIETVLTAKELAAASVRARVTGDKIHRGVISTFEERGFRTVTEGGVPVGFFHGTGHGLGLDIHESPRLSLKSPPLKKGQVITIEPGLYYPGLGGGRIEDVFCVTEDGSEMLSKYHYRWIIR